MAENPIPPTALLRVARAGTQMPRITNAEGRQVHRSPQGRVIKYTGSPNTQGHQMHRVATEQGYQMHRVREEQELRWHVCTCCSRHESDTAFTRAWSPGLRDAMACSHSCCCTNKHDTGFTHACHQDCLLLAVGAF
eukprot:1158763-Pelagomonas_calceolata.AAC.1